MDHLLTTDKQRADALRYYYANREAVLIKAKIKHEVYREEHNGRVAARNALKRAYIDSVRASGCVDCGNKNLSVLQSDHVRGTKVNCVSRLAARASFARIDDELAKCETRCANCHSIVTQRRRH